MNALAVPVRLPGVATSHARTDILPGETVSDEVRRQRLSAAFLLLAERVTLFLSQLTVYQLRIEAFIPPLALLVACTASGPSYEEVMTSADPIANNAVRIFFLRPRDADDGSNGGSASIEVNRQRVGALKYGGFFYIDAIPGPTTLTVYGRYPALGVCKIDVAAVAQSVVYVDVGVRMSYMIAGAIGGAVGGAIGAGAVPDAYGSAGAAIVTGSAGVVAGDAAGTAAGTSLDSRGESCRGPHKLELLAEKDALRRLAGLVWSGD